MVNNKRKYRKKTPHWIGDYQNYPVSNYYYEMGIKPPKNIDKDGDGVIDKEDCNPRNRNQQGWVGDIYKKIDTKLGGILPGGTKKDEPTSSSLGTIYLKPSEKQMALDAGGSSNQSGITISIPETKEVYDPLTKTFVKDTNSANDPDSYKGSIGKVISSMFPDKTFTSIEELNQYEYTLKQEKEKIIAQGKIDYQKTQKIEQEIEKASEKGITLSANPDIIVSSSSPTGYVDKLGQPITVTSYSQLISPSHKMGVWTSSDSKIRDAWNKNKKARLALVAKAKETARKVKEYAGELLKNEAIKEAERIRLMNVAKELALKKAKELTIKKNAELKLAKEKAKIIIKNLVDTTPISSEPLESYNPASGTFQKAPYSAGAGGTVIQRPPTPEELIEITEAQEKGDLVGSAITGVPAQMLGGIFTTPITEAESETIKGIDFLNPVAHYDIFKGTQEYKVDVKKAVPISDKLNTLNSQFENKSETMTKQLNDMKKNNVDINGVWVGNKTDSSKLINLNDKYSGTINNNIFTGTDTQYKSYLKDFNSNAKINVKIKSDLNKYNNLISTYNDAVGKYTTKYEAYSSDPAYQRVINSPERQDIFQKISGSSLPQSKKNILAGVVGATDFATYFVPPVRVIRGTDVLSTGIVGFEEASTGVGKLKAGGQIALGGLLVSSGISKASSLLPAVKSTSALGKVISKTSKSLNLLMPVGFSGLYGAEIYKETDDLGVAISAGVGGFGSMAVGTGAIKKVLPKVETLKIPTTEGLLKTNILGFETPKGKSLILGSMKKGKIKLGTPDVSKELKDFTIGTEVKIGSALETKTLQKSLLKMPLEETTGAKVTEIIPTTQSILKSTKKTSSKFMDKDLLTTATQRLSKPAVKVVLDIAKSEKGIIFGSKSRASQLAQEYDIGGEKFGLIKVPRDIEVRFDTASDVKLKAITEKTISNLKKLGKQSVDGKKLDLSTTREIKDTPYAIEAKLGGKFIKVIEYKGGKGTPLEGEDVPEFVLGIKKVGEPIKVGKSKITPLSEELRGVTQGVLRIRKTTEGLIDISPSPKRMKDIGSVSVSARTLEMSKKSPKLKRKIEKFESFFPKELVREQVKSVLEEPGKNIIKDFSSVVDIKPIKGSYASPLNNFLKDNSPNAFVKSDFSSISKVKTKTSPISKKTFESLSSDLSPFSPSKLSSKSPYASPSISPSILSSISPSVLSSISPSISPSVSPSISPSISPSLSPYFSPSISPSPSPSPNIIPTKQLREPFMFFPTRKRIIKQPTKQAPSYDVYIKPAKRKSYVKVTKAPVGLQEARSIRDFSIDNSVSRQGYLKPRQIKPSKSQYDISPSYSQDNAHKFRNFRQKKGIKTKLPRERKIEYSKYMLDSKSEKNQLSVFKVLSQRKKKQNDFSNPFAVNKKQPIKKRQAKRKKQLNQIWEMP